MKKEFYFIALCAIALGIILSCSMDLETRTNAGKAIATISCTTEDLDSIALSERGTGNR